MDVANPNWKISFPGIVGTLKLVCEGKFKLNPSRGDMAFGESPNKSSMSWKSIPETEIGDGALSGSIVGEKFGVVRVLDVVDELLEDEDGL